MLFHELRSRFGCRSLLRNRPVLRDPDASLSFLHHTCVPDIFSAVPREIGRLCGSFGISRWPYAASPDVALPNRIRRSTNYLGRTCGR